MNQTNHVKQNIKTVYEFFIFNYSGNDVFSHISNQLTSQSSLIKALTNLQSAPHETRYFADGKVFYEHASNRFALSSTPESDSKFVVERLFYDKISVDLVTYIGEGYLHRAAFVHNGVDTRIVSDAFGKPKDKDTYINGFLETVKDNRKEILKAAHDLELPLEASAQRQKLEHILDSIPVT